MPDPHSLISQETQFYLRDCYDHTIQLMDLLDTYREMCGDLRDYHLSAANAHMNEIMKLLTIISTIFMPLSFIAGVYGMNFNTRYRGNMPELNWPYGYVYSLVLMAAVGLGLVAYFWRKGWFGAGRRTI
jgi:magnesium transporter